jgi:hypothetical protein
MQIAVPVTRRVPNMQIAGPVTRRVPNSKALSHETYLNINYPFVENLNLFYIYPFVTGKAVPLQTWSGSEVPKKLKFPDFLTTAQDCGKGVSLTHRSHLPPRNTPGTHSF